VLQNSVGYLKFGVAYFKIFGCYDGRGENIPVLWPNLIQGWGVLYILFIKRIDIYIDIPPYGERDIYFKLTMAKIEATRARARNP
jgi:hypothetical protein